jgi:hypothetical protein
LKLVQKARNARIRFDALEEAHHIGLESASALIRLDHTSLGTEHDNGISLNVEDESNERGSKISRHAS